MDAGGDLCWRAQQPTNTERLTRKVALNRIREVLRLANVSRDTFEEFIYYFRTLNLARSFRLSCKPSSSIVTLFLGNCVGKND